MTDSADLVRFVRTVDGDPSAGSVVHAPKMAGRGAWLCASTLDACAAVAVERRAFDRAFRGPVTPRSVLEAVRTAAHSLRASERDARG